MAWTTKTLSLAAYEALAARRPGLPPSVEPRIAPRVNAALELLGKRVAQGPSYRSLQKDFDATPTAGVYDTSAVPTMLFDINRSQIRVASSGVTLRPIDNLSTLDKGGLPSDVVYYADDGGRIVFRSTTPALNDYVTPLKIRTNFIPTLAEVSIYGFDGALLETLVGMISTEPLEASEMAATG